MTDAGELVRWFPLEARVEPGRGGKMFWGWKGAWDWHHEIDAWEPARLLRLVQNRYRPYDADGRPLPEADARPVRVALEFTLESRGGTTRVRLVHSGFERGGAWDDEFDGIRAGWQFELRGLRFYLERHRGRDRYAALVKASTGAPMDVVWNKLLGAGGYVVAADHAKVDAAADHADRAEVGLTAEHAEIDPTTRAEGRPYTVTTPEGERFSGTILFSIPGRELAGIVRELDGGVFRLATYRSGGQTGVMVWLATYGAGKERVDRFGARAQAVIEGLFAPARA